MSDSPSPPSPPDYVGAAVVQGAANKEAAIASGHINNPNVNNPYGSQRVTWDGVDPTVNQTLSPEQQILYEKGLIGKNALLDTGNAMSGYVKDTLSQPLDFTGLPDAPGTANKVREDAVKAMMSRVDVDTAGQRDAANSSLIAAGIRPGTAAYGTAMQQIDRQYNDARQQAVLGAGQQAAQDYGQNMQSRQQAITELLAKRDTPLNEISALQSGTQVSNPFSGNLGYQAGANVQATPYANAIANQGQAQQGIYNQQQASYNSNLSAGAGLIGSLGAAAITR